MATWPFFVTAYRCLCVRIGTNTNQLGSLIFLFTNRVIKQIKVKNLVVSSKQCTRYCDVKQNSAKKIHTDGFLK